MPSEFERKLSEALGEIPGPGGPMGAPMGGPGGPMGGAPGAPGAQGAPVGGPVVKDWTIYYVKEEAKLADPNIIDRLNADWGHSYTDIDLPVVSIRLDVSDNGQDYGIYIWEMGTGRSDLEIDVTGAPGGPKPSEPEAFQFWEEFWQTNNEAMAAHEEAINRVFEGAPGPSYAWIAPGQNWNAVPLP